MIDPVEGVFVRHQKVDGPCHLHWVHHVRPEFSAAQLHFPYLADDFPQMTAVGVELIEGLNGCNFEEFLLIVLMLEFRDRNSVNIFQRRFLRPNA